MGDRAWHGAARHKAHRVGCGVALWQPDDLVIQRHPIDQLPEDETEIFLRTGIYYLDDGARWACAEHAGSDAIFVPISARGERGYVP